MSTAAAGESAGAGKNASRGRGGADAGTIAAFVLTALIWGSTWLAIKGQLGTVPPSWSVTWRFVGAAAGMAVLCRLRGVSLRLDRAGLQVAALIGLSVFCVNFQFVYRAEQYLTSGLVAVIFALLMVPNALFARAFLGQRMTAGFLAGSAVALGGIALLMLHEYRLAPAAAGLNGGKVLVGGALTLAGLISASVGNVLQASATARAREPLALLAWAMGFGALADVVVALVLSGPPRIDLDPAYLLSVAYLAIVGSVLTFPLYNHLLRTLGPGPAAYNGVVVPVVAMLLSTLFESYRWSLLAAAGSVLAMAGLLLALRARNPSR